jgi:hypothetical protein
MKHWERVRLRPPIRKFDAGGTYPAGRPLKVPSVVSEVVKPTRNVQMSESVDGNRHADGGRNADGDGHAGVTAVSVGMSMVGGMPAKREDLVREFFCRHCDRRVTGNVPPGWYRLVRRILPGSLGPGWDRRQEMLMGFYCSIVCLNSAMTRLAALDQSLRQRGIGLNRHLPGDVPPVLSTPKTKGGPQ